MAEPIVVETVDGIAVEFLSNPVETGVRIVEMFVCLNGYQEEQEDGAVVLELPSAVRLPVPVR